METRTFRRVAATVVFGTLLLGGAVAAQTNPSFVNVTTSSATTPSAGAQGVTLGTVTLTGSQSGEFGNVTVTSIPLTLTTGGGASASQLTNCQVYNAAGSPLTSGSNVIASGQSTNTITFDTPLVLSGGSTQSLTVRCNVASGTPSGGSFSFNAGTPVLAPSLMVTLTATPSVQRGSDILLATLQLNASRSSQDIQVSSIPLSTTFGSGANASMLTDCRVRPTSNLSQAYNSGTNVISLGGSTLINLDTPLTIPAGSMFTLGITCDVGSSFPTGSTIGLSINPSDLQARVPNTNTVTPTRGFVLNGTNPGTTAGTVTVGSSGTGTSTPPIPGVPNTGLGGGMFLTLLASGILAVGGLLYLLRRRTV